MVACVDPAHFSCAAGKALVACANRGSPKSSPTARKKVVIDKVEDSNFRTFERENRDQPDGSL
jgi:hypothetical protein